MLKTNILEKTPKMEKNFSEANLNQHCVSPLVFSAMKIDEK